MPHQLHLAPTTTEEAAEILRNANAQNKKIEITGAGTKRSWGHPVDADILLSTKNLTGLKEHPWQDLTATASAGTTWQELQQALALHNQRVALDPLFPSQATIGGIIATNDSGALRAKYGSLRDLIIGMAIVLADGTIAKSGGKVVKNVAGYDLHKLMTGAFGTLGLITEVTFRLHPLPAATETWTITAPTITPLDELRKKITASTLSVEAMQLRAAQNQFALDIQFASLQTCLDDHSNRLRDLASPLTPEKSNAEIWQAREKIFATQNAIAKLSLPSTAIANLATEIISAGGQSVTQQSGLMTASLPHESVTAVRTKSESVGGNLFLYNPNSPSHSPWGKPPSSIHVMKEIKSALDHLGTINHHRFLDHI